MMRFGGYVTIWLVVCFIGTGIAPAQDAPKTAQDEIRGWIRALSDDKFSVRETATQRLTEFGQAARKPMQQVVNDPQVGLETKRRARAILDLLARSVTRDLALKIVPTRKQFDINDALAFEFRIRNLSAHPIRVFNPLLAGAFGKQIEFAKGGRFVVIDANRTAIDWKLRCIDKYKRKVRPLNGPVTIKPGQEHVQTIACTAPLFFRYNPTRGHIPRGEFIFDVELRLMSRLNDNDCHLGIVKARSAVFRIGDPVTEAKRNRQRRRSKPVRIGDFGFELLAPAIWPDVSPGHRYHFDLGLRITNHGKKGCWFVQNEMKLIFTAANGKAVPDGLNRDSLRVYPPIYVPAGDHRDIAFPATLQAWENGVKSVRIVDKTGGYWCFEPITDGKYSVSLRYRNKIGKIDAKWASSLNKRFQMKIAVDAPLWTGEFSTHPLEFVAARAENAE